MMRILAAFVCLFVLASCTSVSYGPPPVSFLTPEMAALTAAQKRCYAAGHAVGSAAMQACVNQSVSGGVATPGAVYAAPAMRAPQSSFVPSVVPALALPGTSAGNCPGRLTCGQIGSCLQARHYLANCSWGGRLDGDGDGVPCESLCR
jgi:hypothetical protein